MNTDLSHLFNEFRKQQRRHPRRRKAQAVEPVRLFEPLEQRALMTAVWNLTAGLLFDAVGNFLPDSNLKS